MNFISVSLGEVKIAKQAEEVLVCYGLGSCVAVCLYDNLNKIAGMFHCVLPCSNGTRDDTKYANIGINVLLEEMQKAGSLKFTTKAKIVGGACVLTLGSQFDVGSKNIKACREILKNNFISIISEDVGNNISRTVKLFVADGSLTIKSKLGEEKKI